MSRGERKKEGSWEVAEAAGDVLRGSGDHAFDGEVCEKEQDIVGREVLRVPLAVEGDELPDAEQLSFVGAKAHPSDVEGAAPEGEESLNRGKVFAGLHVVSAPDFSPRGGKPNPWMILMVSRSTRTRARVLPQENGQSLVSA